MSNSFEPRRDIPRGQRCGLNSTGGTLSGGRAVTGTEAAISYPAAVNNPYFGHLRGDTPDGAMGTVQTEGKAVGTAGTTGVTAGQHITFQITTGKYVNVVDANPAAGVNIAYCGVAEQTAAADALFEFDVRPGIYQGVP